MRVDEPPMDVPERQDSVASFSGAARGCMVRRHTHAHVTEPWPSTAPPGAKTRWWNTTSFPLPRVVMSDDTVTTSPLQSATLWPSGKT